MLALQTSTCMCLLKVLVYQLSAATRKLIQLTAEVKGEESRRGFIAPCVCDNDLLIFVCASRLLSTPPLLFLLLLLSAVSFQHYRQTVLVYTYLLLLFLLIESSDDERRKNRKHARKNQTEIVETFELRIATQNVCTGKDKLPELATSNRNEHTKN